MECVKKICREKDPLIRAEIVKLRIEGYLKLQLVSYQQALGHLASPDNRTRSEASPEISGSMSQERFRLMTVFLDLLAEQGFGPEYLWTLKPKHYDAVISELVMRGTAPGNLRKHISAFRCLYGWMDKSQGLKANRALLPASYHRLPTYARRKLTWTENGVDFLAKLALIPPEQAWIRAALELIQAFGLRLGEAMMIDLNIADRGLYLLIYTGSKGRRWRIIPIDTPAQRALVKRLKAAFPAGQALIGPDHLISKERAKRDYYRVVRVKLGITKKESGVVTHGLRAEFLCRLYRRLTGEDAPILGGRPVAPARDRAARRILAFVSGHSRLHISRFYIGKVKFGWRGTQAEAERPLDVSPELAFLMRHEAKVLKRERPRVEALLAAREAARTQTAIAAGKRGKRVHRKRRPGTVPRPQRTRPAGERVGDLRVEPITIQELS